MKACIAKESLKPGEKQLAVVDLSKEELETLISSFEKLSIGKATKDNEENRSTKECKLPAKVIEEEKKAPPKKLTIEPKPYTKHTTPAGRTTKWIEVPIKELVEFYRYEINYENVKPSDIVCPICRMDFYDNMLDLTDTDIEKLNISMIKEITPIDVVMFGKCHNHFYHKECAEKMINNSGLKCAICGIIYGTLIGDMPYGKMTSSVQNNIKCSGYPDCGTIVIHYNIPSGTKNGLSYHGTRRCAYLPNNKEGQEVLRLLKIAFERKLTFVIGTSVTTGATNTVVWNGIHHKSNLLGGATRYGYPDPTYFNRVKQELAAKGVFPP